MLSHKEKNALGKSEAAHLFQINPFDISDSSNFDTTAKYIQKYKIVNDYAFDSNFYLKLKKELLNKKNYVHGFSRSCEFLPTYVINTDTAYLYISVGNCPKMMYDHKSTSDSNKIYDLVEGNGIEKEILSFVQGK